MFKIYIYLQQSERDAVRFDSVKGIIFMEISLPRCFILM